MKNLVILFAILLSIVTACSMNEKPKLTRIDVQGVNPDGGYQEEKMILDQESFDAIEQAFNEIKWERNVKVEMSRREDIKAIFFIQEEKNMPERLIEHRIWINGENAEFVSSHPNDSYGKLNGEPLRVLKKELMEELNIN